MSVGTVLADNIIFTCYTEIISCMVGDSMSRQPRVAGEYLHIIVRGIGKQLLFEDTSDNEKYLFFLKKYATECRITLLAYCLMENHVHLLLRDSDSAISVFMKKTGVCYAQYFNRKYNRSGHLFQDRYKSEIVTDDTYLLSVFRYILNNPEKAGICPAEAYRWSSYHEYEKKNMVTDTSLLQDLIGDKAAFLQFMQQEDFTKPIEADPLRKDDARALATLRTLLNISSGTELQKYNRTKRDTALVILKSSGLSIRQIERLTGINRGVIQKAKSCQPEPSP